MAPPGLKAKYGGHENAVLNTLRNRALPRRRFRLAVILLQEGVQQEELIEAITHLAFYSGWRNAMSAIMVAKDLFSQPENKEL
jgi:hypothetical protein